MHPRLDEAPGTVHTREFACTHSCYLCLIDPNFAVCFCGFVFASGEQQDKSQVLHKVPLHPLRVEESVRGGRFHTSSSQQSKCFRQHPLLGCVQPLYCQNEKKRKPIWNLVWDHVTYLRICQFCRTLLIRKWNIHGVPHGSLFPAPRWIIPGVHSLPGKAATPSCFRDMLKEPNILFPVHSLLQQRGRFNLKTVRRMCLYQACFLGIFIRLD